MPITEFSTHQVLRMIQGLRGATQTRSDSHTTLRCSLPADDFRGTDFTDEELQSAIEELMGEVFRPNSLTVTTVGNNVRVDIYGNYPSEEIEARLNTLNARALADQVNNQVRFDVITTEIDKCRNSSNFQACTTDVKEHFGLPL